MFDANFGAMSRRDRDDLDKLARMRAQVAKANAAKRKAEPLADFEAQMATQYAYDDDEVWKAATEAADAAVKMAQQRIDERCAELGIPKAFRPGVNMYWHSRGENGVAQRRTELRRVATTQLDAMEKEARAAIDAKTSEVRAAILGGGLETAEARAFVESMPTAEALMPPLDIKAIRALRAESSRYGYDQYALDRGEDEDEEEAAT
jgi:hypothetical protein